ncbi:hypothetical protein [Mycolicibacterium fortuitum]|uniref:hypothetical protein n=1 Tax=Mycolicibacterium fortuitum TaxID=1766 RepID=UPI002621ECCE|nr:hypothetical protein [Mycolicibacterium fortuitum]
MASSLLTVWEPEVHTIIDVRAVSSLVKNGETPHPGAAKYPPYVEYLAMRKAVSHATNPIDPTLAKQIFADAVHAVRSDQTTTKR